MRDDCGPVGWVSQLQESPPSLFQGEPHLEAWPSSPSCWPRVDPAKVTLRRELLQALPGPLLRLHGALPLELHHETLILGMENPCDLAVQETVRRLTGWEVVAVQLCPDGGGLPSWSELQPNRQIPAPVGKAFQLLHTKVEADVLGPLAGIRLIQTYRNTSSTSLEGLYRVPIPHSCVQQGFWADGETQALATASLKRTLLGGRLQLSARVGSIEPGQNVTLTLSYVHPLERDSQGFRIQLPCPLGDAPLEASLQFRGAGLDPEGIRCTRPANWQRLSTGYLLVSLQPQSPGVASDLICHCRVPDQEIEGRLLSDGHHFMLQLRPGPRPTSQAPRDILFLLDRSASLEGWTAEQGRRAVLQCLQRLRPLDRFSLAIFDHQVVPWQEGRRVGSGSLSAAQKWLQYQAHGGGTTDLLGALQWLGDQAQLHNSDRPLYAVLIGDGQSGRQAEACRSASQLRGSLRLFTLGIGPGCEAHFLGRLASLAGGSSEVARSSQELTMATHRLCSQIGPPAVSQVRLVGQGFHSNPDLQHPTRLPDLFAGQVFTVFGKHQGAGPLMATGLTPEAPISLKLTPTVTDHPALASLWAREHLNALQRTLGQVPSQQRNKIVEQMRQLRLEYLIDSSYVDTLISPQAWSQNQSSEGPATRLADALLGQAVLRQASHIHVETGAQTKIRLRICGRLHEYRGPLEGDLPSQSLALVSQFKRWCRLQWLLNQFQSGHFERDYQGSSYRFEVSFCPAINGEKVVLEIRTARPDCHSSVAEPGRSALENLLTRRRGLLLLCGPKGSGGSSLMVDWLGNYFPERHSVLCHKEDWFGLQGVTQVLPRGESTQWVEELETQDIDVLACTRTRERPIWEALLRQASERSLVLARHHARSAAASLVDLVDQGLDGRALGKCFLGAVSLHRVPRLCDCKIPEREAAVLDSIGEPGTYCAAVGCPQCHGSGFRGSFLCSEVLLYRPDIVSILKPGIKPAQVEKALIRYPLEQQLQRLAQQGLIEAKHGLGTSNIF